MMLDIIKEWLGDRSNLNDNAVKAATLEYITELEAQVEEFTKPKCQHLHIEDTGWEIGPRQRCIDCGACLNTSSTPVFVNTKKDKE